MVSAAILAPAALVIVWLDWWDYLPFLVLVAVAVSLLSYEWSVMIAPRAPARVAVVLMLSVLSVIFIAYEAPPSPQAPARLDYIWSAITMIAIGCLLYTSRCV